MTTEETIQLKCPTCGAGQSLADECRRCKCDLSLVAAVLRRREESRRETLTLLRAGRLNEALRAARRLWAIAPDADASRYLAVCHLLKGRYAAALAVYEAAQERFNAPPQDAPQ
ncbi:MAG: tetratricopeptide repeat protein [Pirellulaceae bacterium]